jgi:hypothetical protein
VIKVICLELFTPRLSFFTLVRDATAAFKAEMMHAARELNGPTFGTPIAQRTGIGP